jgi:hypothetical protein
VGNFDLRRDWKIYTLNMSDLTSVFPITSIFVTVYLQTTFHIQYMDISTMLLLLASAPYTLLTVRNL